MAYPWPGLREDLYLGGFTFVRQPATVGPKWLIAKESVRARDASLHVDFLQPETGWPVILTKLELQLGWDSMAPDDIRTVNMFVSRTALIDVCNWVEISESFWFAAGASFAGYIKRRNALTVVSPLPPLAATRHAVTASRGGGSVLTVTLGTPDAGGITPWTAAGTSAGEYVTVNYTPAYCMMFEDRQQSFPSGHEQGENLLLVEA